MKKRPQPAVTASPPVCVTPPAPTDTPYGEALAGAVADQLVRDSALGQGAGLAYNHRDYCGMGLDFAPVGTREFLPGEGYVLGPPSTVAQYRYGSVNDGRMDCSTTRWTERAEFVAWLARQSDRSLHGDDEDPWVRGNQRLTRARLEAYLASPRG